MKSILLTVTTILLQSQMTWCQSATETTLEILWPIGTHLVITATEWSEELKNDKFIIEDSSSYTLNLSVKHVTPNTIELDYTIDDPMKAATYEWMENLPSENQLPDQLTINCQIDKKTAEIHIPNWKELSDKVTAKYNKTLAALNSRDGEMAGYFNLLFDQYIKALETEEGIVSLYANDLRLLLIPYGKNYEPDRVTVVESEEPNPFNPKEKIKTTEKLKLLPTVTTDQLKIEYEIIFDMKQAMQLMREMVIQMNAALSSSKKASEEKLKELDAIKMEMTNLTQYQINRLSTLPLGVQFKMEMAGFDGKKNRMSRKYKNFTLAPKQ